MSESYQTGRGGKVFLAEESTLWAPETEVSPRGVAEQEDVQKERRGQEASLKCASMLWSARRIQVNLGFSLALRVSAFSQTYSPMSVWWWYLYRDSGTPAMLS